VLRLALSRHGRLVFSGLAGTVAIVVTVLAARKFA
jgi:hypothetical protein